MTSDGTQETATVAPLFQMWLWCKSVAISRTGFGLRNPGQSQTLMRYRKCRFHAISADLESVGQGWCLWRNGAKSCPDRPQPLRPDSQPNHISWWLPPLLPILSEGIFLSFTFSTQAFTAVADLINIISVLAPLGVISCLPCAFPIHADAQSASRKETYHQTKQTVWLWSSFPVLLW